MRYIMHREIFDTGTFQPEFFSNLYTRTQLSSGQAQSVPFYRGITI